jgi:hypothetical protein
VVIVAQTGVEELYRPKHIAVVRDGQVLHPQGRGLGSQGFHRGRAVQEGIIGMNVEMHKVNHIMIVPSPGDFSKEWGAGQAHRGLSMGPYNILEISPFNMNKDAKRKNCWVKIYPCEYLFHNAICFRDIKQQKTTVFCLAWNLLHIIGAGCAAGKMERRSSI